MKMITEAWDVYYHPAIAMDDNLLPADTCGKWMYFFLEEERSCIEDICTRAVESGATYEAKMSTPYQMMVYGGDTGVACFYIDGSSDEAHQALLSFMLEENLFPYDEDGCLKDVDFKFDWQTREGMYDEDSGYIPQITLSDYVDLTTGELL